MHIHIWSFTGYCQPDMLKIRKHYIITSVKGNADKQSNKKLILHLYVRKIMEAYIAYLMA